MGIFDIFRRDPISGRREERQAVEQYFKLLSSYSPVYSTYQGSMYEMHLTRAAIHAFATHCGKLQPRVTGSARIDLGKILLYRPNALMDTYSFLYRLATILKTENTAFIIPILNAKKMRSGLWPERSQNTEVRLINGVQYLLYPAIDGSGRREAIEFSLVGVMRNHYYRSPIYGESHSALDPTLNLMSTVDQGIVNGVKNSANIRFLAKLAQVINERDITKERKRFSEEQLGSDNNGGVMLIDKKYESVTPIESKQLLVDPDQVKLIQDNVYSYTGVNQAILQNNFNESQWDAFYEGAIEPFAIQLSLVLSNLYFTEREKSLGNGVILESNRLQYASNATKINIVTQLFDRGFICQNQGLEIFNMKPVDGGNRRWIRGEYVPVDEAGQVQQQPADQVNPPNNQLPAGDTP